MNELTKLEQLLAELCPNGVEYKKVKHIFKRLKGTPITAGKMKQIENPNGEIKIFAGGKTVINANVKDIPNANIIRIPAVLVQSRGVIDVVYYDKPFTFKNEMWAYTIENKVTVKFLYYILKNNIKTFRNAASGMGALPQISLPITEEFKIPFPPLPVQEEIVRILDEFTEKTEYLISELNDELKERKKQYTHYLDKSFNFNKKDSITYANLNDMCSIITKQTGFDYTNKIKEQLVQTQENGALPYIQTKFFSGKEFDYKTDYYIPKKIAEDFPKIILNSKCLLFSIVGASIGNVGLFTAETTCFLGGAICVAKPYEHYNIEYLYYYMISSYGQRQISSKIKGSGQATVTIEDIRNFVIPLTDEEQQNEIVSKLKQYDLNHKKIVEIITREIKCRKQQYEYYRDQLLTFKEIEA